MDAQALRREIETFLAANHVMSLATTADDGTAHAASLFYVPIGLSLIWTSDPGARHSQHLEQRRSVAATVAPECADFRAVRGLQLHGPARRLDSVAEIDAARRAMRNRYPFLDQLATGPPALREAFARAGFYRFDAEHITLIDNAQGFGHKAALRVLAGDAVELAQA